MRPLHCDTNPTTRNAITLYNKARMSWQATVDQVQNRRDSQIPLEFRVKDSDLAQLNDYNTVEWITARLNAKELAITSVASATELAKVF